MFNNKFDLEYKRDRVKGLKQELDECIKVCREYIQENPHEFYSDEGISLLDLINQLEAMKSNLKTTSDIKEYQKLLEKFRKVKDYVLGKQIDYAKKNLQGKVVKVEDKDYTVPYVEGLYPALKKLEKLYYLEKNLVPDFSFKGGDFIKYSKALSQIVDKYDCEIIKLESRRFFR